MGERKRCGAGREGEAVGSSAGLGQVSRRRPQRAQTGQDLPLSTAETDPCLLRLLKCTASPLLGILLPREKKVISCISRVTVKPQCLWGFKRTDLALARAACRLHPTNAAAEPRKSILNTLEGSLQKPHELTRSLQVRQSCCCWLAVQRCSGVCENSKTFDSSSVLLWFAQLPGLVGV